MGTKQNTYKNTIELKPEFLNDGKVAVLETFNGRQLYNTAP